MIKVAIGSMFVRITTSSPPTSAIWARLVKQLAEVDQLEQHRFGARKTQLPRDIGGLLHGAAQLIGALRAGVPRKGVAAGADPHSRGSTSAGC
jgi:hypothetical protein